MLQDIRDRIPKTVQIEYQTNRSEHCAASSAGNATPPAAGSQQLLRRDDQLHLRRGNCSCGWESWWVELKIVRYRSLCSMTVNDFCLLQQSAFTQSPPIPNYYGRRIKAH